MAVFEDPFGELVSGNAPAFVTNSPSSFAGNQAQQVAAPTNGQLVNQQTPGGITGNAFRRAVDPSRGSAFGGNAFDPFGKDAPGGLGPGEDAADNPGRDAPPDMSLQDFAGLATAAMSGPLGMVGLVGGQIARAEMGLPGYGSLGLSDIADIFGAMADDGYGLDDDSMAQDIADAQDVSAQVDSFSDFGFGTAGNSGFDAGRGPSVGTGPDVGGFGGDDGGFDTESDMGHDVGMDDVGDDTGVF